MYYELVLDYSTQLWYFQSQKNFQGYSDLHLVVALDNHHQHRLYLHFECKSQVLLSHSFNIEYPVCSSHGKMFTTNISTYDETNGIA